MAVPVSPQNSNSTNLNQQNSLNTEVQGMKVIQTMNDNIGNMKIMFGRLPDGTQGLVASRQGEDVRDAFNTPTSGDFSVVQNFNTLASNTQGVCFDDTYFYITEASEIMKYTRDGTFVDRHDTTGEGSNHHLGDVMIKDGVLYVPSSDYPSTPYNEIIMRYDADTLTYIDEFSTFGAGNDHIAEGIDYRHGHFWTVSDNYDNVYKWQDGFTSPTTYPITEPTFSGSAHHLQTIVWQDDDHILMDVHGGPSPALPQKVLKYRWTGNGFTLVDQYQPPAPVVIRGQGMAWDATKRVLYFANRNSTGDDSVTGAKFVTKLAFDSRLNYFKIVQSGTISASPPASWTAGTVVTKTIRHNLGTVPAFLVYVESPELGGVVQYALGYTQLPTSLIASGLTLLYTQARSDTNNLYIDLVNTYNDTLNDWDDLVWTYKYYILQETAN